MGYAALNWGHAAVGRGWVQQPCAHPAWDTAWTKYSVRRFGPCARPCKVMLRALQTALTPFCTTARMHHWRFLTTYLRSATHKWKVKKQNTTHAGGEPVSQYFSASSMCNSGQRTGCWFEQIIRLKRHLESSHYLKWLLRKVVKKILLLTAEMHPSNIHTQIIFSCGKGESGMRVSKMFPPSMNFLKSSTNASRYRLPQKRAIMSKQTAFLLPPEPDDRISLADFYFVPGTSALGFI